MDIGDRVRLVRDVPPAREGSVGTLVNVDSQGNLTVEVMRDPEGNEVFFLLPPAPADNFQKDYSDLAFPEAEAFGPHGPGGGVED